MSVESKIAQVASQLKIDRFILTKDKKLDHVKLSFTAQCVLAIYLIWMLSQLTWMFFADSQSRNAVIDTGAQVDIYAQSSADEYDLTAIKSLNLFGQYNKPVTRPKPKTTEAPITRLNLKLSGVVASNDPKLAAVIIEKSGQQETYGIEEKIKGTSAVIKEIFSDRVILEQRGKRETLMLEGAEYTKLAQSQKVSANANQPSADRTKPDNSSKTKRRLDKTSAAKVDEYRKEILSDPGKINEYIKATPAKDRETGNLIGYRIRPGKSVELFKAFGLRSGDIAVEINGYDLTDLSQAMTAMQELRTASEASLIVNRNGELIETFVSLN
ncbi:type II secretion system protein GspC [Catenovulum sp. SM1970]|uniref:type II secretion system protein GspC n=1 Tax=Marinifaba aquimaris TaxID=2741323 RepID=UPI001571926A|nr:type II secretion system protein GspC [Marinifaba aquimaris]NTS75834.1 type II secretion system protein GspC [Marinifaba aquimaris]